MLFLTIKPCLVWRATFCRRRTVQPFLFLLRRESFLVTGLSNWATSSIDHLEGKKIFSPRSSTRFRFDPTDSESLDYLQVGRLGRKGTTGREWCECLSTTVVAVICTSTVRKSLSFSFQRLLACSCRPVNDKKKANNSPTHSSPRSLVSSSFAPFSRSVMFRSLVRFILS